jgi:hypothetical protein
VYLVVEAIELYLDILGNLHLHNQHGGAIEVPPVESLVKRHQRRGPVGRADLG